MTAAEPTGVRAADISALDRVIHEPARLLIMTILATLEAADFVYLTRETGLTAGNLGAHLTRLETAGYVEIEKTYRGRVPRTVCRLTEAGLQAYRAYREALRRMADELPDGTRRSRLNTDAGDPTPEPPSRGVLRRSTPRRATSM